MRKVRISKASRPLRDRLRRHDNGPKSWSGVVGTLIALSMVSALLAAFFAAPSVSAGQSTSSRVQTIAPRSTSSTPTASQQGSQPFPIYGPIQAKSSSARSNDPKDLQAFVDEVFRQTGFGDAATSLRARVARAELAYREGRQKPVEIDAFVRAVNRTVSVYPLPSYFKTSRDQVALQQVFVKAHAPKGL